MWGSLAVPPAPGYIQPLMCVVLARARLDTMRAAYSYQGDATCAADGMCQEKCPVKINTGELIKSIRAEDLKAAGANASRAEALSMVRTRRCVALALMLTARVVRGHRIAVLSKALSMVHTPCWAALARARGRSAGRERAAEHSTSRVVVASRRLASARAQVGCS